MVRIINMKKFLGILVLSLVLSGCGGEGMKNIDSQVQLWNNYKNHTVTYKAYFEIFEWQGKYSFENFWRGSYDSLDAALAWSHQSEWCKKGCKVLYIGNEKRYNYQTNKNQIISVMKIGVIIRQRKK